jgi:hypothetical protein
LRSRSLADYTIDTHESEFSEATRDYQDEGPIMKKLAMLGIIGAAAILTAAPVSLQWSQKAEVEALTLATS